jgi:hypothetical protein
MSFPIFRQFFTIITLVPVQVGILKPESSHVDHLQFRAGILQVRQDPQVVVDGKPQREFQPFAAPEVQHEEGKTLQQQKRHSENRVQSRVTRFFLVQHTKTGK